MNESQSRASSQDCNGSAKPSDRKSYVPKRSYTDSGCDLIFRSQSDSYSQNDNRYSQYRRPSYHRAPTPCGERAHDCCTSWTAVVRGSGERKCNDERFADDRAKQLCLLLLHKVSRWWRWIYESQAMAILVRTRRAQV